MTDLIDIAWLAGLIALGVIAARAARVARLAPDAPIDRARVLAAAALAAALGVGAAWVWGIAPAADGMNRLAAAPRGAARARVFVRAVAIPLAPKISIGYAPDGGVRLPASYDLDEEQRGWDLVDVAADGPAGLDLAPHPRPEPTTTRVLLAAIDRDHGAPPLDTDDAAALAARLLDHRACGASTGAIALHGPGAAVAVLCKGAAPVAALVLERDLANAGVRATPLVWRGTRFVAHQVDVAAGEVLEVGRAADVAPGLTAWEVPAPAGQARILVPPDDVLAPCRAWSERSAVFAHAADVPPSDPDAIACVLPYAPPFVLEVRRLVPDLDGIDARSLWAAGLFATVALFALLALSTRRRGEVTQARFARALAGAWLGVALAAIAVARLLWAHRIDMLRDFEPVGERVIGNQVAIVLAAAALACAAARDNARATGRPLIAWAIVVAGGGWALRADAGAALAVRGLDAQIALSLLLGTAGAWVAPAARFVARLRTRLDALAPSPAAAVAPAAPMVVLAAAAALAGALAPHAVVVKLALAWTAVVVGYHALRGARLASPRARVVTLAVVVLALGALARLDAGVTAAIVVPGLAAALITLGHDARFGAADGARLGAFERDHAPVVLAHAALVGIAACAVGAWALTTTRADLPVAITRGALGGALVLGALLAIVGAVALRRRGLRSSAPWLALAAACGALWLARDAAIARATDGNGTAAGRVAQILDPGAALLRDPSRLVAGMTAARETVVDGDPWRGQGYFGAQVVDPGVMLSIENDYAPVLVLREGGVAGILRTLALLVAIVAGLWWLAGERFAHGSAAGRSRRVVAATLGGLVVYQPLAALGLVPLTGIAWPGFGLDSPTDLWALVAIALFVALGAPPETAADPKHDRSLRTVRAFGRARRATSAAAALALAAAVIVVGRGALHAAGRASPLDDDGRASPGFEPLARAADYASHLVCPIDGASLAPADVIGQPDDATTRRYHADLRAAFARDRGKAADELVRFAKDPLHACSGDLGAWHFARAHDADADTCDATWRYGWPAVHVTVVAAPSSAPIARCAVELAPDALAALHPRAPRSPDSGRVRLVAEAMGAAARDRGELVAGHLVVRLRPGAGQVDVGAADAGLYAGDAIRLAAGAQLTADASGRAILHVDPKSDVALLQASAAGWTVIAARGDVALDRAAIVVVGRDAARRVWSFRPPRAWTGDTDQSVAPLLADDVGAVAGRRRRHYVYGGDLPELGWVNPYRARQSLGLDGWVHVATAETGAKTSTWLDGGTPHAWCGTLDAPPAMQLDARVCAPSPDDGVLECRVTVQPELELQLRHLTEIIADDLPSWAGKGAAPTRASFVVLRGDTGAIVAAGDVVPGRASSAYAPSTAALERYLVRLREDRDPATGARRAAPDEASAERSDWNEPIAVGSAMKPLVARAAELAAPAVVAQLFLAASDSDPPPPTDPTIKEVSCRSRRGKIVRPVLGHCPPTPLVDRAESFDFHDYLARSSNWYQAVLGIAGLAFPDGTISAGDQQEIDLTTRPVDSWLAATPLVVSRDNAIVVGEHGVVVSQLERAPLWRRFEALVGRPLCTDDDATCRKAGDRRDLCALRALPIAAPTSDLRHLVALGPDRFDLSEDKPAATIPLRDYFQFLRGSGLHPLGSLAQLADAFGRIVYDPSTGDRYALAASWFPTAAIGKAPDWDCARGDAPVEATRGAGGGLCGVVQRGGTAAAGMKSVLADPRVIVYGAKTGTIDALADVSENDSACEQWNHTHTIAGKPARAEDQPYWLPCGKSAADDSLFVVAFGVKTDHGVVPFTLALDFQRTGKGVTAALARHYIDAIAAYFTAPSPASTSTSSGASSTSSGSSKTAPSPGFAQPPQPRAP